MLKYAKIQKEIEDSLKRPTLDLTHRMSFLLAITTIVYFFCGGMPLMLILFTGYMLLFYWVEKFMVLKFYRKPVNLDDTVMKLSDY